MAPLGPRQLERVYTVVRAGRAAWGAGPGARPDACGPPAGAGGAGAAVLGLRHLRHAPRSAGPPAARLLSALSMAGRRARAQP